MARFNEEKTLATILYLSGKSERGLDLYSLVKLIYFADKAHLHRWGRTITGNYYARMEHGPTPSEAYDLIKSVRGDQDWPIDYSKSFKVTSDVVIPLLRANLDEFSESELEILDEVYRDDGGKSFAELKSKAHDNAYNRSKGHWMTDEDLAEGDLTLIEHIKHVEEDEEILG